jgi:hypothetical protein
MSRSRKESDMQNLRRYLTALGLSLAAGLALLPGSAAAAPTTFGSLLKNDPTENSCQMVGPCTIVSFITHSGPEGNPDAGGAPVSGVITKFRVRAYAVENPGQVTFRVADISLPDPNNKESALASTTGTGPTVTIKPDETLSEAPITEVSGRLPVKKGQHLALDMSPSIAAVYNSNGDKLSYLFAPPLVDGSGQRGSTEVVNELLVQASIEPDADGDGFGDETQDQCPTQATNQGPCDVTPPSVSGVTVSGGVVQYRLSEAAQVSLRLEKKLPGRRVGGKCVTQTKRNLGHSRCPRFKPIGAKFSGPGAAGPNKVTLPNGKRLKPGTYRVTITAVDVNGNTTVQTATFRVKKKKHRHR